MRVVVCAKQVPVPDRDPRLDDDTGTLLREGDVVLDPGSAVAVEVGLRLAAAGDGDVTVLSMTPGGNLAAVRAALAMGAARAVVVSDDSLAGSDALGTARVLAGAIARVEALSASAFDVVMAGADSADGSTGTVPVQVAELLGWPSITLARSVEAVGRSLHAERETEQGYDVVVCPVPAVVTVAAGAVQPRHPQFSAVTASWSKPVDRLTLADLHVDPSTVGAAGARQRVTGIVAVPPRAGEIVVDDGAAHERLLAFFERAGLV